MIILTYCLFYLFFADYTEKMKGNFRLHGMVFENKTHTE